MRKEDEEVKCPNCGETSRIRENDRYCHKCGFNLKDGENDDNQFKSIHIDLEKNIFMANGRQLKNVSFLRLEARDAHWSLELSRDELYEAPLHDFKERK